MKRLWAPSSPLFAWMSARNSWKHCLYSALSCLLHMVLLFHKSFFGGFEIQSPKILTGIFNVLVFIDLWMEIPTLADLGPEDSSYVLPHSYFISISSIRCLVGLHNQLTVSSTGVATPWKRFFLVVGPMQFFWVLAKTIHFLPGGKCLIIVWNFLNHW